MRQYRGEVIPEKQEVLKKVNKVHFLIHPSFAMLSNIYANLQARTDDSREYEKTLDNLSTSLNKASEKAKTMGKDELMIAFLFGRPKHIKDQLRNDKFKVYIQKIAELKDILKDRLIVFSDGEEEKTTEQLAKDFKNILKNIIAKSPHKIKHPRRELNKSITVENEPYLRSTAEAIGRIAGARGFEIDPQTLSEAYGEEALACVRKGGANLHRALGLKPKTVVVPELTELANPSAENLRQEYTATVEGYRNNIGSQPDARHIRFKPLPEDEK